MRRSTKSIAYSQNENLVVAWATNKVSAEIIAGSK